MTNSQVVPVAIIGAGPYGLSISAHLRAHGIEHRTFGVPMRSWLEHMPDGMFLKSVGFASNLSDPSHRGALKAFCADGGRDYADDAWPVPIGTFTEYALWFQRELVGDVEQVDVTRVGRSGDGYELELASGDRLIARQVVLAVGHLHFTSVPGVLAGLPAGLVSHASAHRSFDGFAGRDVTVVGAGQSALESAALLHEAGASVRVLVRGPQVRWNDDPGEPDRSALARLRRPSSGLGSGWHVYALSNGPRLFRCLPSGVRREVVRRALGPAGAWWLRPRVLGKLPLETQTVVRVAEPVGDRVRLALRGPDGRERDLLTDHVVAGTGYRVDVDRLGFLTPDLAARIRRVNGAPVLTAFSESSVPGLFFTGLAAAQTFGPVQRFVYGADFAARRIVAQLKRGAAAPSSARAAMRAAG